MAKNKGKRRSKGTQNKQSSPSKNVSSATTRETSPVTSDMKDSTVHDTSPSHEPGPIVNASGGNAGMIRKVSSRVAEFEEAARASSLLNHERAESGLDSPLHPAESHEDVINTHSLLPESRDEISLVDKAPERAQTNHIGTENKQNIQSPVPHTADDVFTPILKPNKEDDFSSNTPKTPDILPENELSLPSSPSTEPQIPQRSVARVVEPETVQTFEAKRQPVMIGRPVMLENVDDSRDNVESDVDLDSYFDSPDDVVVTAATVRKIDSPETSHSPRFADHEFDMDSATQTSSVDSATKDRSYPAPSYISATSEKPMQTDEAPFITDTTDVSGLRISKHQAPENSAKHFIRPLGNRRNSQVSKAHTEEIDDSISMKSANPPRGVSSLKSVESGEPQSSRPETIRDSLINPSEYETSQLSSPRNDRHARTPQLGESFEIPDDMDRLPPPPSSMSTQSSPTASPRAYKYEQSPLPKLDEIKTEPPIIGVCVVGFHHQRGPEVEYWVGPDESQSNMWPYLPFQSLPDGSHQFEENVTYFMLLYDRNRHAATSLTFDRDEDGHIRQGTTDFRNVTTLFAVACSRQIPASDLKLSGDEQYTRSTVQKSVVVIASKPLFGPIKEKLTVVTRSYFAQQNFGDRSIIDHFYHNLVQMPLWTNENDLHVGMNLQKCIHDFGAEALYLLKAMLLETKILFYASDTDVLGTTQFALVSLIPNLINHLEDSGSPLLSSYELHLQRPTHVSSSDRQSLLKYFGLPLQLFAGGGVFSPFVPLQQFDDLKQPETQYGMMGTTNKLFLGTDIDFDVVVNVDTSEVVARNPDVAALLKLTDQDKAFISSVQKAVDTAWDTNDNWQPQALGYYGGEDYIRHEFEEYLMALLASAKYEQHGEAEQSFASSPLQYYGTAWSERWMRTNNFRISNRNTDKRLFDLVDPVHPGVKLQKPSGIERFFGIFKSHNARNAELPKSSSASVASQTSSAPRTPSLASGEKFSEQPMPTTPSTPRRWFWQSEPRDRSDDVKPEPLQADFTETDSQAESNRETHVPTPKETSTQTET